MKLTSRPDDELGADSFTTEELELIMVFIANTVLGKGYTYREAAFSIIQKIERVKGPDFFDVSAGKVDLQNRVLDSNGAVVDILPAGEVEYLVN